MDERGGRLEDEVGEFGPVEEPVDPVVEGPQADPAGPGEPFALRIDADHPAGLDVG
ncbi:hypothetical protein ACGFYP_25200 [Streptomyces sp. NPDC048370]|uniref:hypothetical protein n=1 Tax=Streptomyces sp. NPDC048370 TaxID=3365540 RepID=UPI00371A8FDE